jgi:threonine/homoserine/homoserine lactone efflux protein
MENHFLLKGLVVGFAIAAAIGPIGILCIRKTFEHGRLSGLFSGLGAAVADTLFGIIAAFGLTFISDFLMTSQFWLRLIGGLFLVYLGGKTFLTKPTLELRSVTHKTLVNDFVTTFFLTLVNPTTILSFLAIFAGLGIGEIGGNYSHAFWLVLGIFVGSSIWWVILCEGITFFRQKISQKVMRAINRAAGIVIAAFGILAWITLL